ncbi:hypothetical protein HGRIS_003335 [Hohenbuehelia grisea]|uniref:Uncharacterized protein n=1 Tax=Hohenbuehelia grisea TaxID=104357 RepID=A0ABR3JFQ2_9AGAR
MDLHSFTPTYTHRDGTYSLVSLSCCDWRQDDGWVYGRFLDIKDGIPIQLTPTTTPHTTMVYWVKVRRGGSLAQSVWAQVVRTISTAAVTFTNPQVYSAQKHRRTEAVNTTVYYSAICGIDRAGGNTVTLPGGFHSGGRTDKWERLTATVLDSNHNQMYFHRAADNTYWDRIHIPRNTPANAHLFQVRDAYTPITQQQYIAGRASQGT